MALSKLSGEFLVNVFALVKDTEGSVLVSNVFLDIPVPWDSQHIFYLLWDKVLCT